MQNLVPLPAPIPMPPPFMVPASPLALPNFEVPPWEPVPIYRDDIPALNPNPSATTSEIGEEPEKEREEEKGEGQEENINDESSENTSQELDIQEMPDAVLPPLPNTALPAVPDKPVMETVELPGGFEVPVPPQEIVITAVTTAGTAAVVSVGATMAAGNLFKQIVKIAKPLIKTVLKKLAKLTGKKPPQTWGREKLSVSRQRRQGKKRYRDES